MEIGFGTSLKHIWSQPSHCPGFLDRAEQRMRATTCVRPQLGKPHWEDNRNMSPSTSSPAPKRLWKQDCSRTLSTGVGQHVKPSAPAIERTLSPETLDNMAGAEFDKRQAVGTDQQSELHSHRARLDNTIGSQQILLTWPFGKLVPNSMPTMPLEP